MFEADQFYNDQIIAHLPCKTPNTESLGNCQESRQAVLLYAHFTVIDELQNPHQVWVTDVPEKEVHLIRKWSATTWEE